MKVAVTAKGKDLEAQVDPRFGRCSYFLVVDTDTMVAEAIENPNLALGGGAGIQSAQLMAEHDVSVVLTGNCGPNAHQTLNAAGIQIVVGASGCIRDAVDQFKAGSLSTIQEPNVASHFGMGAVDTPEPGKAPQAAPRPEAAGAGAGMGMGSGRGMGMGSGRGKGMGSGRGMGMGRGMNSTGGAAFPSAPASGSESDALKAEAQNLEAELQAVNTRLEQLGSSAAQHHLVAVVDIGTCNGCGLCESVCQVEAITINSVAAIDIAACTGCGLCVVECPSRAITLQKA